MGMQHSIFAMELCCHLLPGDPALPQLAGAIAQHPVRSNPQAKWQFYRSVCEVLLARLHTAQTGCWDFFDDNSRALADFEMWSTGMITEEGARRAPSGAVDPYRGDIRYMTFTMAFLLVQGSPSERTLAGLCNIPQPYLWHRQTFQRILQGLGAVSFASVKGDVAYVIPGSEDWSLTAQDLQDPKFHYLRQIV